MKIEKLKLKENTKAIVIIIFIMVMAIFFYHYCKEKEVENTVITENRDVLLEDTSRENTKVKLNPSMDIKESVLQNLNFTNFNEDRLVKIKIKVDNKYVYESDFIKPREVFERDLIKENDLKLDGKEAIGEIYSYTTDKELVGQTNVVINLNDNE